MIEALDSLWKTRHEPRSLDELDGALMAELSRGSTSEEEFALRWRAARLHHFCAMQALEDGSEKAARDFFTRGAQAASTAAQIHPTRVEGRFWLGTCALEAARLGGKFAMARVLSSSQAHLEAATKMDEAFHFGGPLRVLGRVTHFKPLLLGGSLDAAIAFYTRALQLFPTHSTTLLYKAEAHFPNRETAEARRDLHTLLNAPDDPDWTWEQARDRKKAEQMLRELK